MILRRFVVGPVSGEAGPPRIAACATQVPCRGPSTNRAMTGPAPQNTELPLSPRRRRPSAQSMLGTLEYPIMRALWSQFPLRVGDVLERLNADRPDDERLAYTTVMTVLSRLHDKGIVDREKQGRSYRYRPRFTEDELVRELSRGEVQRLVDQYGQVALAQFATALQDADPDLLARLVRLADGDGDA